MLFPELRSENWPLGGGSNGAVYSFQVSGSWGAKSWKLVWNFT